MYYNLYNAIQDAAQDIVLFSILPMEQAFAPVPPKPAAEWLPILRNMLDLGVRAISASFFNARK
jgi:hypothetical protein